ncbi:MAG: hypothetical protein HGB04_01700 [Chlorobiaceae bacterium]|nr:hypothetical protein [Chlorobiaceae bacterium]
MTRLHPRMRETTQELIDEVMFRFSVDSREAQELLMEVLTDRGIVNAVCIRIQLRLMDDNESNGGAS